MRLSLRKVLPPLAVIGAGWPVIALAETPRPRWHPGPPAAPLFPGSSEMHQISDLFWVMLIISGVVFAGVCGVLLINIVKFSAKSGQPEIPTQVYGNRKLEILWTLIPSAILAVAFVVTVFYMKNINEAHGATFDVNAIGHQWWWEFQYPSLKIDTADELHVPTGVTIHYHVESVDVIHSFWIPQLQRQIDANPGLDDAVFAKFDTPGIYDGMCYEYCGTAHAWMKFRTIVQTPGQFNAWVKHIQKPAVTPSSTLLASGMKVFLRSTCVNCHSINGTSAGGAVAPNLTHVGSRWTLGAGAAPLSQQDLEQWIADPAHYKPGVLMPSYNYFLPAKDIHAIAAYLLSLK